MTFSHPYDGRPPSAFWSSAITAAPDDALGLVVAPAFRLTPADRIASAGSCFALEITRRLAADGFTVIATEPASPAGPAYAARYGNIYTTRQFRQLIERAYGLMAPRHTAWRRADARFVDPFRPREFPEGFASKDEVAAARAAHLRAVREAFETCSVFVLTLGLTEAWLCDADGMAMPLPPGVAAAPEDPTATVSPHNLTVRDLIDDLHSSIGMLRQVNPDVRIILTVSPVPLAATFTDDHVLVASTYSKAALRVAAQDAAERHRGVAYFPSYELIAANPLARHFAKDRRHVSPEGVAAVMTLFRGSFIETNPARVPEPSNLAAVPAPPAGEAIDAPPLDQTALMIADASEAICDEDMLAQGAAR